MCMYAQRNLMVSYSGGLHERAAGGGAKARSNSRGPARGHRRRRHGHRCAVRVEEGARPDAPDARKCTRTDEHGGQAPRARRRHCRQRRGTGQRLFFPLPVFFSLFQFFFPSSSFFFPLPSPGMFYMYVCICVCIYDCIHVCVAIHVCMHTHICKVDR